MTAKKDQSELRCCHKQCALMAGHGGAHQTWSEWWLSICDNPLHGMLGFIYGPTLKQGQQLMSEEKPYRAYCKFCEWISDYETLAGAQAQVMIHKATNNNLRCNPQTEPVPKNSERKTCERCGRQKPAGIAENGAAPEGWGEWLCWGDPIDCDKHRAKTHKLRLNIELSFDEAKQIEDCLRWAADSALIDPRHQEHVRSHR